MGMPWDDRDVHKGLGLLGSVIRDGLTAEGLTERRAPYKIYHRNLCYRFILAATSPIEKLRVVRILYDSVIVNAFSRGAGHPAEQQVQGRSK